MRECKRRGTRGTAWVSPVRRDGSSRRAGSSGCFAHLFRFLELDDSPAFGATCMRASWNGVVLARQSCVRVCCEANLQDPSEGLGSDLFDSPLGSRVTLQYTTVPASRKWSLRSCQDVLQAKLPTKHLRPIFGRSPPGPPSASWFAGMANPVPSIDPTSR